MYTQDPGRTGYLGQIEDPWSSGPKVPNHPRRKRRTQARIPPERQGDCGEGIGVFCKTYSRKMKCFLRRGENNRDKRRAGSPGLQREQEKNG